ncbi:hypothetical protein K1719_003188 [Acacia pycnantha]|nr:hypothetical protein K1719_003188 [Acacia pycnantha]
MQIGVADSTLLNLNISIIRPRVPESGKLKNLIGRSKILVYKEEEITRTSKVKPRDYCDILHREGYCYL